jgi:NTP pyrophosphatase (non-canonical NTP hydrolase)
MKDEFQPLTISEYVARASSTDQQSDEGSLSFPLLGLFGEAGSLLSEVKKKQRDRASYLGYSEAVVDELGDVLWYLATVASRGGISLANLAREIGIDGSSSREGTETSLSFASLQPAIMARPLEPSAEFERTLLRLAGEIGLLLADHENGRVASNSSILARHLIAIMRTLIQASNEAGVTLEAAAVKNLAKIFDRWPQERIYPTPLDEVAEKEEQLPRILDIDIFERKVNGNVYVFQRCNGVNIGDRLTDNAVEADDYRFHDVFHYAYVAVLTWSPVIRSLFRLKRKSDSKVDEAQDGARATLVEEGIATWVFGKATAIDYFSNVGVGDLPFDMLKHVRQFTTGYEAERLPLWLWEEAILQGYSAFRFLREHRRGRLHIDMHNRRLTIEKLL